MVTTTKNNKVTNQFVRNLKNSIGNEGVLIPAPLFPVEFYKSVKKFENTPIFPVESCLFSDDNNKKISQKSKCYYSNQTLSIINGTSETHLKTMSIYSKSILYSTSRCYFIVFPSSNNTQFYLNLPLKNTTK